MGMSKEQFQALIAEVTGAIAGEPVEAALADTLNARFPAGGEAFGAIDAACRAAIAEGWMCEQEAGGVAYGRVFKPGPETHGFSVDVVRMADRKGPYHGHPNGEIDMIMPSAGDARFDGHAAGWLVYGPETAHYPTVSGGEALVLYLLPDGAIDFKAKPAAASDKSSSGDSG